MQNKKTRTSNHDAYLHRRLCKCESETQNKNMCIQLSVALFICSITHRESFVKVLSGSVNISAVFGNTVFFVSCGADFNP